MIFYDGYNDTRNLCRQDVDLAGHARQELFADRIERRSKVWPIFAVALRELIGDLRKAAGRLEYPPSRCMEDETYADRIAEMMLSNWRIARAVAHLVGADFLAFLQPTAAIGSPNLEHLSADAFSLDDYSTLHRSKLGRGIDVRIVYPRIEAAIQREGADWIHDLTDAFDGDEYIYMGPSHVTGNGNAIIAERISRIARPLLDARTGLSAEARSSRAPDPRT